MASLAFQGFNFLFELILFSLERGENTRCFKTVFNHHNCSEHITVEKVPIMMFVLDLTWDMSPSWLRPLDAYWHVINQRPIHGRPIRWRRRGCAWTDWQTSRVQSSSRGSSLVAVTALTATGPGPNCTTPASIEQGRMFLELMFYFTWTFMTVILVKVFFCACSFCVFPDSRLGWFETFQAS